MKKALTLIGMPLALLMAVPLLMGQAFPPPSGGGGGGGGGSGVSAIGAFSGSSQANGASISGSTITFGPADGTNPGLVTTGADTWSGTKTFTGNVTMSGSSPTFTASSSGQTLKFSANNNIGTIPAYVFDTSVAAANAVSLVDFRAHGTTVVSVDGFGSIVSGNTINATGVVRAHTVEPLPSCHTANCGAFSDQGYERGSDAGTASGTLSITFGSAFAHAPVCTCSDINASPVACGMTAAPTTVGVPFAISSARADTIDWLCTGDH